MIRFAALLLLASQLILLLLVYEPSGRTATLFTFLGTPLLGLGLLLFAFAAFRERMRRAPRSS
jgi:multisubunit Na+/H+ antiporter MnhB subunit